MSASAARSIAESCGRPMLHARSLGFVHPVSGEDVNFAVDPPLDFVDVFTELSKY
jgi:23S rRNA-/tRNA-specific pseudouridylate synthase